ncbi:aldolase/citrate lyase family protein [Bradyrhizobium sp. LHD-71]|uniref:HpcH/HpaI aldolase family protein n=1 Tax=Bradyrhizobium sp. LHD-71 TaxID=3072141 RepID=UPI00280D7C8E|nr:aldolase/citrate lyase family protein [Bradyrhizobium sp. LHD-71]MDQ8728013.1 aldolase/citrate lyase family protein [Bradyrhizobium sp. LHD-71]
MNPRTNVESGNDFRRRFSARERLVGTFIKTQTSHAIEILGDVGFDFVVIDQEHAPFDRGAIDIALLAARASNIASIVRVDEARASSILSALDCGAAGVLVPHVFSADKAREIASWSRYGGGRRGYSGSARAGRYGATPVWTNVARSDARTTVIAMIEDPEALETIDAIAGVEGIDGFFIGRGDLTVSLGAESSSAPEVQDAVRRISAAARSANKPVCVMVGSATEARSFQELGATAFIVSSDQGFLRRAASEALKEFSRTEV